MSPSLGDSFPKAFRDDLSTRIIQPGAVFRLHIPTTTPPKTKRIVILAISGDKVCVGYLFINSEINPNIFHNAKLRNLHLRMENVGRDYLDHDSYLDCSAIQNMDFNELTGKVSREPGLHIGNIGVSEP